jgi:hypothetical protein
MQGSAASCFCSFRACAPRRPVLATPRCRRGGEYIGLQAATANRSSSLPLLPFLTMLFRSTVLAAVATAALASPLVARSQCSATLATAYVSQDVCRTYQELQSDMYDSG